MEICQEKGISVDSERFQELVKQQRDLARADHLVKANSSWADNSIKIDAPKTIFTGYKSFSESDSKILAIFNGAESIDYINEGDNAVIVLDKTPFYAESGGQTGDIGKIITAEAVFTVTGTTKTEDGHYLHVGTVDEGTIRTGETAEASICKKSRQATMKKAQQIYH